MIDPDPLRRSPCATTWPSAAWSDGIPIDAADLLLAWAAGSQATAGEFDSIAGELQQQHRRADVRRVRATHRRHASRRRSATGRPSLDVAVPAHVVGGLALGIEDPMEAKQAVIDAITDGDDGDLAAIAKTWNSGFDLTDAGDMPDGLTVGSGRLPRLRRRGGRSRRSDVTLEVNRAYDGDVAAGLRAHRRRRRRRSARRVPRPTSTSCSSRRPRRTSSPCATWSGATTTCPAPTTASCGRWCCAPTRAVQVAGGTPRVPAGDAAPPTFAPVAPAPGRTPSPPASRCSSPPSRPATTSRPRGRRLQTRRSSPRRRTPQGERARAGVAAGTEVCVCYDTEEAVRGRCLRRAAGTVAADAGWAVQRLRRARSRGVPAPARGGRRC